MTPLSSFVYAPMSLKGELLKQHEPEITPEPRADMLIGNDEFRAPHKEWTVDHYGNVFRAIDGQVDRFELRGGGRFLYKLHDVVTVQHGGIWHIALEPGVCAREACPWRRPLGLENLKIDMKDMGEVTVHLMRDHPITLHEKEPCVFHSQSWDNNYYHRVMDSLPRGWAEEEDLIPAGTKWNHKDHQAVRYDTLYFPSFWPSAGFSPSPVKWIRKHLKKHVHQKKKTALLLSRADQDGRRNLDNEDDVLMLLQKMGLSVTRVVGAGLTFAQQIKLAEENAIIIGPHGAAMTNCVFGSNAAVIELVPQEYQTYCFQYLAKWAGNWYARVLTSGREDTNMTADLEAVERAVKEAMAVTA